MEWKGSRGWDGVERKYRKEWSGRTVKEGMERKGG